MWSRLNLFKWNVIFFPLEFTHVIFQVSNISHAMWFVSLLFLSHTIIHTLYMERHSHNSSCSSRWPWLRRVCVRQDWARVCACVSVWWSQAWWVGHCRWAAGSEQCHSERCAGAHSRGSSPPPPPIERHHQTFIHTLTLYLSICNTHTVQITDLSSLTHTHTHTGPAAVLRSDGVFSAGSHVLRVSWDWVRNVCLTCNTTCHHIYISSNTPHKYHQHTNMSILLSQPVCIQAIKPGHKSASSILYVYYKKMS